MVMKTRNAMKMMT